MFEEHLATRLRASGIKKGGLMPPFNDPAVRAAGHHSSRYYWNEMPPTEIASTEVATTLGFLLPTIAIATWVTPVALRAAMVVAAPVPESLVAQVNALSGMD